MKRNQVTVSISLIVKLCVFSVLTSIASILILSNHYEHKIHSATDQWEVYSECNQRFSILALLAKDTLNTPKQRLKIQWEAGLSDFENFLTENSAGPISNALKDILIRLRTTQYNLLQLGNHNETETKNVSLKRELLSTQVTLLLQEGLLLSQKQQKQHHSNLHRIQSDSRLKQIIFFTLLITLMVLVPGYFLITLTKTFAHLLELIESFSNNPDQPVHNIQQFDNSRPLILRESKALNDSFQKMAVDVTSTIEKYNQSQQNLTAEVKRFHTVMDAIDALVYVADMQNHEMLFANKKCIEITGDYRGKRCWEVMQKGQTGPCEFCSNPQIIDRDGVPTGPYIWEVQNSKDGKWYECRDEAIEWVDGKLVRLEMAHDITQKKNAEVAQAQLEKQLFHAQKMQSIGTLAGGIAHDFNNILSSIIGFTELALEAAPKGSSQQSDLEEVCVAGNRAKELVQQILAYARHSDKEIHPVKVANIIKEVLKLLRPSTPTTIEIQSSINSSAHIMANGSQLHQIVMNLCTNATHSLQQSGGVLKIQLHNMCITENSGTNLPELPMGEYVELTITDNGSGIDPAIIDNIFEPYFTTKDVGEGSGMGLAMVKGIIDSYNGDISVQSHPGKETTFTVRLPITKEHNHSDTIEDEPAVPGAERILFVDDEPAVARMGKRMLNNLGYTVTIQNSSIDALEMFSQSPENFDLIITDMTMPHMTGDELAIKLRDIKSNIPIILCSGYTNKINDEEAKGIGINAFTSKPFTRQDLAKTVRSVLDEATLNK